MVIDEAHNNTHRIDASFTGDVLEPAEIFEPESMVFLTDEILTPERQITAQTPRIPAEGLFQGAALKVGAGRVFMSGEAAMFSAQIVPDGSPYGFNHPNAPHNAQFSINALHWLSGVLVEDSRHGE